MINCIDVPCRVAGLRIDRELLLDILMPGVHPGFYCSSNPLPSDAKVVDVEMGQEQYVVLILRSESFSLVPPGGVVPELPSPIYASFAMSLDDLRGQRPELFMEEPAPDAPEEPAPDVAEGPAPDVAEGSAPDVAEGSTSDASSWRDRPPLF